MITNCACLCVCVRVRVRVCVTTSKLHSSTVQSRHLPQHLSSPQHLVTSTPPSTGLTLTGFRKQVKINSDAAEATELPSYLTDSLRALVVLHGGGRLRIPLATLTTTLLSVDRIRVLDLHGCSVTGDLSAFAGLRLVSLNIEGCINVTGAGCWFGAWRGWDAGAWSDVVWWGVVGWGGLGWRGRRIPCPMSADLLDPSVHTNTPLDPSIRMQARWTTCLVPSRTSTSTTAGSSPAI